MERQNIINYLNNHAGSRLSHILDATPTLNRGELAHLLYEMESDGIIYSVSYSNIANMEFYNKWYLTNN